MVGRRPWPWEARRLWAERASQVWASNHVYVGGVLWVVDDARMGRRV